MSRSTPRDKTESSWVSRVATNRVMAIHVSEEHEGNADLPISERRERHSNVVQFPATSTVTIETVDLISDSGGDTPGPRADREGPTGLRQQPNRHFKARSFHANRRSRSWRAALSPSVSIPRVPGARGTATIETPRLKFNH
jgi:hypothetical protein